MYAALFLTEWGSFFSVDLQRFIMEAGLFYFLKDQYFIDFPDHFLMKNKESSDGMLHNRPCFMLSGTSQADFYG